MSLNCLKISIEGHALQRMFERNIQVGDVLEAVCPVCKNGALKPGTATVTLERGEALIIFRHVRADVCNNCGAYFVGSDISKDLFSKAEEALNKGAVLEVLKLSA